MHTYSNSGYLLHGVCMSCCVSQMLCLLMKLIHVALGLHSTQVSSLSVVSQGGCLTAQASELGLLFSCLQDSMFNKVLKAVERN